MEEKDKETSIYEDFDSGIPGASPEDTNLWSRISSRLFRRRRSPGESPRVRLMPVTLPCLVAAGLSLALLLTPLGKIGAQVKDLLTADPPTGGGITLQGGVILVDGAPTGTCAFTNSVAGWSETFGGEGYDSGHEVQQTSDGGYIIIGETRSFGNGKADFWLVKTDSEGNLEWEKFFGGPESDWAGSVQQTSDGGYILTGSKGWSEDSGSDIWLIKTDPDGDMEWDRTFGGTERASAHSVQQTADGGYIIAGTKRTSADDPDAWLIKTDPEGTLEWDRTFGGSEDDIVCSVRQTTDGGYIVAGSKYFGGTRNMDAWLVKTDSKGKLEWENTFGNVDQAAGAFSVMETSDGGYIINGHIRTGRISGVMGDLGACLIKTDSLGNLEWDRTLEDISFGYEVFVHENPDGGYIIAGCASDGLLFIELDTQGNLVAYDEISHISGARYISQPTFDGGFIITGCESQPYGKGIDMVLIKVGTTNPPSRPDCFLYEGGEDGKDWRHWEYMCTDYQAEDIDNLPTMWSMGFSDLDKEDTHAASQWQVREASGDYNSPVFDSGRDTINLEEIALSSGILDDSTGYFARVRYQDSQGLWSDYSDELSFTGVDARVSE